MKLNIEPRDDHQAKIVAEFEPSDLDKYKVRAARRIASKGKIPGFRPGKAPYDVIARIYGEPAIEEDAIELMMEAVYPEILTEAKIEPAAPGTLEDVDKGDPLKFTFVVPLEPTVDLGNFREIRKKYSPKSVTGKQVDEFIQRLRRTYATAEPVERPAESGDLVYLKVDATLLKPTGDEKPELLKDSPLQLVIGENDSEENDYPYPGFGDTVVGMAVDETKKFKYTYPKDSKFEKLRSKAVEFNVLLQNVKKLTLPEMNDEFAKMFGEDQTFDQLKEAVKEQLTARQTSEYDEIYFEELITELARVASVKYPPQVLEHEMEHVVENVTHDLSHQNMELDVYLKTLNKEKDAWMEEEVKPAAIKNLTKALIMQELAKVEAIKIGNEEMQTEVTGMLTQMQQSADAKALDKQLKDKKYVNALTMEAASRVMNRKVFERIRDIATGKIEESAVEEIKPVKTKKAAKSTETVDTDELEKNPTPAKKSKKTAAVSEEEKK